MIEAKSLRLENKVLYEGKICTVNNLFENNIRVKEHSIYHQSSHESHYEGVPVTPDILEKCGFEKKKDPSALIYYERNSLKLAWYEGKLERISITEIVTTVYYPEYKYLHQIQNLYFILTGEEFEINL